MKLHVLGRGCGSPEFGGVMSGYLVEAGDTRVLLDCGPGIANRLLSHWPSAAIDAVVLSHLHHDHCLDLFPLEAKLVRPAFSLDRDARLVRIPIFVPPGGRDTLATIAAQLGNTRKSIPPKPGANPAYQELAARMAESGDRFFTMLPCTEFQFDEVFSIGDLTVQVRQATHAVPAASFRIEHGGLSLVYTGDTGSYPDLIELARGADLLLSECTEPPGDKPFRFFAGHMAADDVGTVAAEAEVRRLALTHFFRESYRAALVSAVRERFGGQILVATPGEAIDVASGGPVPFGHQAANELTVR